MASWNRDGLQERNVSRAIVENVLTENENTGLQPVKAVPKDKSVLHGKDVKVHTGNTRVSTALPQKQSFEPDTSNDATDFDGKTKENGTLDFSSEKIFDTDSSRNVGNIDMYELDLNSAEILLHTFVKRAGLVKDTKKRPDGCTTVEKSSKTKINNRDKCSGIVENGSVECFEAGVCVTSLNNKKVYTNDKKMEVSAGSSQSRQGNKPVIIEDKSAVEPKGFKTKSSKLVFVTNTNVENEYECFTRKPSGIIESCTKEVFNEVKDNTMKVCNNQKSASRDSADLCSVKDQSDKNLVSDDSDSFYSMPHSSHVIYCPTEENSELCSTSTSSENLFPSTDLSESSDFLGFSDDFIETDGLDIGSNVKEDVLVCNGDSTLCVGASDVSDLSESLNDDVSQSHSSDLLMNNTIKDDSIKVVDENFDNRREEDDKTETNNKTGKEVKNGDETLKLGVALNGETVLNQNDGEILAECEVGKEIIDENMVVCAKVQVENVNGMLVQDEFSKSVMTDQENVGSTQKNSEETDMDNGFEKSLKSEYDKKDDCLKLMSGVDNGQSIPKIEEDPNLKRMKYLECPFTWRPDKLCNVYRSKNNIVASLLEREKDYLRAERDIFREFVIFLILAYERSSSDESSEDLQKCYELITLFAENEKRGSREQILPERLPDNEEKIRRNDEKIEKRTEALRYILFGSTLFILKGKYERKEFNEMPAVEIQEFDPVGRATILAVKAAVLSEYGYDGNYHSFQFFKEAAYMDPGYWQWKLYYGKAIERRLRLSFYGKEDVFFKLSTEQIENLQMATELRPNHPSLLIHLGNAYRHYASQMYRMWRIINNSEIAVKKPMTPEEQEKLKPFKVFDSADTFETCQMSLFKKASECFEKAFRLEKYSPNVISRCAHAMGSLPYPYKNADLAGEGHKRALCMAPDNSMVNHYAGLFYERMGNFKMALELYERATECNKLNYTAEMSAINIRLLRFEDEMYCPTIRLHHLLRKYPEKATKVQTFTHMGFYYYRIEKQLTLALRCFYEAVKLEPRSQFIRNFVPWKYYDTKDNSFNTVSLLQEIIRCLRNANCSVPLQKYLDDIVQFLVDNNIKP